MKLEQVTSRYMHPDGVVFVLNEAGFHIIPQVASGSCYGSRFEKDLYKLEILLQKTHYEQCYTDFLFSQLYIVFRESKKPRDKI